MALILNIETSTTLCSVTLAKEGKIISLKEINNGYTHAENLHLFIETVFNEAAVSPIQLNAVAVGSGPGSYTGLRIGVSAAKGFAFALNIPLIAVNTLQIMAAEAVKKNKSDTVFCPLIDARRMEVYTAIFDKELNTVKETSAKILPDDLSFFNLEKPICFFGDGMLKCKELLAKIPESLFLENVSPSAISLAELSFQKHKANLFEDTANFEPFYLKDFLIKKPTIN